VDERSYAVKGDASAAPSPATSGTVETKKRQPPFRATKDQVIAAQKALRAASIYTGEETGKLDDATRDGLKKYQEANALKVTGTLNQATLEKMGIELTDRQKASAAAQPEK
jgi:peptidoglycan hydrolase-like protein with peptidoglycan-binding domain